MAQIIEYTAKIGAENIPPHARRSANTPHPEKKRKMKFEKEYVFIGRV
jgi:hypothetical protein